MSIHELAAVVPPPAAIPFDEEAWRKSEEWLLLSLPDDYREFSAVYGTGMFCESFLQVYCPSSYEVYRGLIEYEARARPTPAGAPYKRHPSSPGLLMWCADENGNRLHLLTSGDADNWPVVAESHEGDFEKFDLPITSFLAKALTNEIRPKLLWGQPFSPSDFTFFRTHG